MLSSKNGQKGHKSCGNGLRKNKVATFSVLDGRKKGCWRFVIDIQAMVRKVWFKVYVWAFNTWTTAPTAAGLHWNLATSIIQVLLKTIGGRRKGVRSCKLPSRKRVDFITWSFGPSHPGEKRPLRERGGKGFRKKAVEAFKFFYLEKKRGLLKNEKLNFHFKSGLFLLTWDL